MHCKREIGEGQFPVHLAGRQAQLQRCAPEDTGKPYGYNAHQLGTPCESPCLGSVRRD